ncbi:hypothetical protein [Chromobacterium sp. ATCC 53434]|uniref:hypothetical protein n=1 Tax=Chromobacterium sp. (strain ATCC 53434 / SC 14030) TaxID=2059672 RepID=UPI0013053DB9|nr:hypothetical protein [Chromobacterium sp. ATCC 53434]
MRKVLTAMVLSVFLLFHGCGVDDGIIGDVKQLRKVNRRAYVDISDIARRHIVIGGRKEAVEKYLTDRNFKLYYLPISANEKQSIGAVYIVRSSMNIIGFHDEIRVTVNFENDVVSSVDGRLIYRTS